MAQALREAVEPMRVSEVAQWEQTKNQLASKRK